MRLAKLVGIAFFAATPAIAQGTRPTVVPAYTPRESAPAFIVECRNDSTSAVPWPAIRTVILDGDRRELTGGIAGSLLGEPGERFEIAPGGVHRILFVLTQTSGGTSFSPGRGLGARVRQSWLLPVAPGTHRISIACLGEWSDEIGFAWSPDPPAGR